MFRGSVKSTGYPLHSPVSCSFPLPCVTVFHHISTGLYKYVRHFDTYPPNHDTSGLMAVESHHRNLNPDNEVRLIKSNYSERVFQHPLHLRLSLLNVTPSSVSPTSSTHNILLATFHKNLKWIKHIRKRVAM